MAVGPPSEVTAKMNWSREPYKVKQVSLVIAAESVAFKDGRPSMMSPKSEAAIVVEDTVSIVVGVPLSAALLTIWIFGRKLELTKGGGRIPKICFIAIVLGIG